MTVKRREAGSTDLTTSADRRQAHARAPAQAQAPPLAQSATGPAAVSAAGLLLLQRMAGNRAAAQAVRPTGRVIQRKLDMDSSWAWIGGRGWATGAKELWSDIEPRFQALLKLIADLKGLHDDEAFEPEDVDRYVMDFSVIADAYDRRVSLEEGKALQQKLDALGLPKEMDRWSATVKADLGARKRQADESREAQRLRLAEERRRAEAQRLEEEAHAQRLAEENRRAEATRRAEEKKTKDDQKRKERAEKRSRDGGPSEQQQAQWVRQKQGGTIRTELSALMMGVNARPVDDLVSTARANALAVQNVVDTTLVDAGTMTSGALSTLEARVRTAQQEDAAAWRQWGPSVELLAAIGDPTLRGSIRAHLRDVAEDRRAEHVAFLQSQLPHIDLAFAALDEAHRAAPLTAVSAAKSEMDSLARYNYDESLRSEMEASLSHEVEQDIAQETARLESERDRFLEENPEKTRKEAGSKEAREAIVEARKAKRETTASHIQGLGERRQARIGAGLGTVEDLLGATGFSEDALSVARWGIALTGKDPARLRRLLETYARVSARVTAPRFIRLVTTRPDLDDVNWALGAAKDDFDAARTYLSLLESIDKSSLGGLAALITDRGRLSQLVLVHLRGLKGADMLAAVRTLRPTLDEARSVAVLSRLFDRSAGLSPAQLAGFLDKLDPDRVNLLSTLCVAGPLDVPALRDIVIKGKGTGSDVLRILGVRRINVTLGDVDTLLDAPKFVKGQGGDVASILESPAATVAITKDLLGYRTPAQVYSYIDLTRGSHEAPWVLAKLQAEPNQTFWTGETCGAPAYTGHAANLNDITARAVAPPVIGRYAGGNTFHNIGGVDNYGALNMLLPGGAGHNEVAYREYDLREHDGSHRGPRRMVVGGGHSFYTADHYGTFARFA